MPKAPPRARLEAGLARRVRRRRQSTAASGTSTSATASTTTRTTPGCRAGATRNCSTTPHEPENVRVRDSCLFIRAVKAPLHGCGYTSARLKTKARDGTRAVRQAYGRGVPRPRALGQGPVAGAVDAAGGRQVRRLGRQRRDRPDGDRRREAARGAQQHPLRLGVPARSLITTTHALPGGSKVSDWHTYAVEWEPGEIRFYVDERADLHLRPLVELQQARRTAQGVEAAGEADLNPWPAPFDQPFYLLMNVAVGGNFPGAPERADAVPGRAGGGLRARVRQGGRLRPRRAARRGRHALAEARACVRAPSVTPRMRLTAHRGNGRPTRAKDVRPAAAVRPPARTASPGRAAVPQRRPGGSAHTPQPPPLDRRPSAPLDAEPSAPRCSAACTACASAPTSKASSRVADQRGADPRAPADPAPHTRWVRSFSCTDGHEQTPRIAHELGLKTLVGAWLGTDAEINERELEGRDRGGARRPCRHRRRGQRGAAARGPAARTNCWPASSASSDALPGVPVGYVDAYYLFEKHPRVTAACDVVMTNCYPFWEGCPREQALAYMQTMVARTRAAAPASACSSARPAGPTRAAPSRARCRARGAMQYFVDTAAWAEADGIEWFYFAAFDEAWKVGAEGDVGAFWGLWDKDGPTQVRLTARHCHRPTA
jgi:glucan 1,3-beta-glucosidase